MKRILYMFAFPWVASIARYLTSLMHSAPLFAVSTLWFFSSSRAFSTSIFSYSSSQISISGRFARFCAKLLSWLIRWGWSWPSSKSYWVCSDGSSLSVLVSFKYIRDLLLLLSLAGTGEYLSLDFSLEQVWFTTNWRRSIGDSYLLGVMFTFLGWETPNSRSRRSRTNLGGALRFVIPDGAATSGSENRY